MQDIPYGLCSGSRDPANPVSCLQCWPKAGDKKRVQEKTLHIMMLALRILSGHKFLSLWDLEGSFCGCRDC